MQLGLVPINGPGTAYYAIWDTVAGGDSRPSEPGNDIGDYVDYEQPYKAFDGVKENIYTNFGYCASGDFGSNCGINTGIYFIPSRGLSSIQSFRFMTAGDLPPRDPITVTLECTNETSSLTLGSSWTLIYSGTSGLDVDPGRYEYGIMQYLSNTLWCLSYRILTTSKRGDSNAVHYSELELMGY